MTGTDATAPREAFGSGCSGPPGLPSNSFRPTREGCRLISKRHPSRGFGARQSALLPEPPQAGQRVCPLPAQAGQRPVLVDPVPPHDVHVTVPDPPHERQLDIFITSLRSRNW